MNAPRDRSDVDGAGTQCRSRDVAGPLDLLLTDAALGPTRRFFPGMSALRFAGALAQRPRLLAGRATGLAAELGRIVLGTSPVAPTRRDRRFADPAWTPNPVLRRIVQAYLATGTAALGVVEDVPLGRDAERVRFAADNVVEALAPSNNSLLSPVAWKAAIDMGGGARWPGRGIWSRTWPARPPRVPQMVPPDAFEVGTDLGLTPGSVVWRTPVLELIQYRPQTPTVRSAPLLIVPPTINKF